AFKLSLTVPSVFNVAEADIDIVEADVVEDLKDAVEVKNVVEAEDVVEEVDVVEKVDVVESNLDVARSDVDLVKADVVEEYLVEEDNDIMEVNIEDIIRQEIEAKISKNSEVGNIKTIIKEDIDAVDEE
ncbi:10453_t:CDS:2, partial [Racocetra persica]